LLYCVVVERPTKQPQVNDGSLRLLFANRKDIRLLGTQDIIWEDIDQPRAINLDTNVKILVWIDWGENPKIEKDRGNRKVK